MIVVFFATIIVAKGMKMQLPSSDRKKIVTQELVVISSCTCLSGL